MYTKTQKFTVEITNEEIKAVMKNYLVFIKELQLGSI